MQLISNLVQTQLAAAGTHREGAGLPDLGDLRLDRRRHARAAPEIMAMLVWPDAPSPYTWGHISWDADGGINYLGCSSPRVTDALAQGPANGVAATVLGRRRRGRRDGLLAERRRRRRLRGRPAVAEGSRAGARAVEPELAADRRAVGGLIELAEGPPHRPADARLGGAAEVGVGVRCAARGADA